MTAQALLRRRPKALASIVLLGLLALTASVAAQEVDTTTDSSPSEAVKPADLTELRSPGGTFDSLPISDAGGAAIEVGEDKEVATFRLTVAHLRHHTALTISSPVDKDSTRADFVGFAGVNQAATAKLDYTYVHWPRVELPLNEDIHDPSIANEMLIQELTNCALALHALKNHAQKMLAQDRLDSDTRAIYEKVRNVDLVDVGPRVREWIELGTAEADLTDDQRKPYALPMLLEKECKDSLYVSLAPLTDELEIQVLRLAAQGKQAFFFNLQVEAGNKKLEFFDASDLAEDSSRETPTSFGASFGWVFLSRILGSLDDSIALTYRRENGFEAAKPASLCEELPEPEPTSGRLERCKSLPLGPPIDTEANFFGAEFRHLGARFGTGFRVFYRESTGKENEFGLEVPFYFLPTKEKTLAGGVRLGWTDQTEENVTVFVSKTFEPLFGKTP